MTVATHSPHQGSFPFGGEDPQPFGRQAPRRRHVQFLVDEFEALTVQSGLSPGAAALLRLLMLVVSPRDGGLTCSTAALAELLGLQRRRAGPLRDELAEAGLITWSGGRGKVEGRFRVLVYDRVAAKGRKGMGRWVPVVPDAIVESCSASQLDFEGWDVLLRVLLIADERTAIAASNVTELATKLGITWRRAKGLDRELCRAVEWRPQGLKVLVYDRLVARSLQARDSAHLSRAFVVPEVQEQPDTDVIHGPRDFAHSSRPFTGSEACGEPPSARDFAHSSRDFAHLTARNRAFEQGESGPSLMILDDPSFLACSTEPPDRARREGKEEGAPGGQGIMLLGQIGATLKDGGQELFAPRNGPACQLLGRCLDDRLASGWTGEELVAELTSNLGGVRSEVATIVARAKSLPTASPRAARAAAVSRLEDNQRGQRITQAEAHARTLASVIDPATGERRSSQDLDEELRHHYGSDPDLLGAARAAAGVLPRPGSGGGQVIDRRSRVRRSSMLLPGQARGSRSDEMRGEKPRRVGRASAR